MFKIMYEADLFLFYWKIGMRYGLINILTSGLGLPIRHNQDSILLQLEKIGTIATKFLLSRL